MLDRYVLSPLRGGIVFFTNIRWFSLADSLPPPANFLCPSGTDLRRASVLYPPQQERRAETRDHRADREEHQVAGHGRHARLPEAHHAEGVAEVREREGLRQRADAM